MGIGFVYDDGGRSKYFKGSSGDCVCRSIAIATKRDYKEVYDALTSLMKAKSVAGRGERSKTTPRDGVPIQTAKTYLKSIGWEWVPTMGIGGGCKVHLKTDELPAGRLIVRVTRHVTTMIDGTVYDTHDPRRGGTRCVYGYWRAPE
jgi:hypothetical protein